MTNNEIYEIKEEILRLYAKLIPSNYNLATLTDEEIKEITKNLFPDGDSIISYAKIVRREELDIPKVSTNKKSELEVSITDSKFRFIKNIWYKLVPVEEESLKDALIKCSFSYLSSGR